LVVESIATYVVVLGDQVVDGEGEFAVFLLDIFLPVPAGRLAVVGLVLEDGEVAVGDVFGFLLFQDALVRDRVPVDVVVVSVVEIDADLAVGTNGGGDREGEDGGKEEELHVGSSGWYGCVWMSRLWVDLVCLFGRMDECE
jgi:hypothetical protein